MLVGATNVPIRTCLVSSAAFFANLGGDDLTMKFDLRTTDGVTELEEHIRCRLNGQVRDFQLVLAGAGLLLRGEAPTYYAKQLAQHAVMEATGLHILANEIEVC